MLISYIDQIMIAAHIKGVSVLEACKLAGINPTTFQRWKLKKTSPRYAEAVRVMDAIGHEDSPPEYVNILAALRKARIDSQLSQMAVDAIAGFTDGQIAKYESGARTPHSFNLYIWALSLGLALSLSVVPPQQSHGFQRPDYKGADLDERIKAQSQGNPSGEPA